MGSEVEVKGDTHTDRPARADAATQPDDDASRHLAADREQAEILSRYLRGEVAVPYAPCPAAAGEGAG